MNCGIACLQMVCAYYGKNFNQNYLSSICHATAEGVSLLGIKDAAAQIGFNTISWCLTLEELLPSVFPCILHWNQNHFVVLYKIKNGKKFYIADPGKGLITYSREEFESHWISTTSDGEGKGIAMFFETTPEFYTMNTDSEDNIKERRSLKFLAGYVRKYRRQFALIVLGMVLGSACSWCCRSSHSR